MADDITTLKKTFDMPSTAATTSSLKKPTPGKTSRGRTKGRISGKAEKAGKVKTVRPGAKKTSAEKTSSKAKTVEPGAKKTVVKKNTALLSKKTVSKKQARRPTKVVTVKKVSVIFITYLLQRFYIIPN